MIFQFSIFCAHLCWCGGPVEIFTAHGLFSWTTSKNITAIPSWRTLNTLNKSFTWFWSHPCPVNSLGLQFYIRVFLTFVCGLWFFTFWILFRILQGHQPHHVTANPSGRTLNKCLTSVRLGSGVDFVVLVTLLPKELWDFSVLNFLRASLLVWRTSWKFSLLMGSSLELPAKI